MQVKANLFILLLFLYIALIEAQINFDGCDETDYYSGIDTSSTASRSELAQLIQSTHRRSLPYTDSGRDDVWRALMELDVGESGSDTVHLIYRDVDIPANLFGQPDGGWNREHVWPKSRGVETEGYDYTDIHHLKPADWNVNSARSSKYFSACRDSSTCRSPAHPEAAVDTEADAQVLLPPESARGIVARAMMYMDLRYDGSRVDELDLELTDCPEKATGDDVLAYLSQLLEWHQQYPPTYAEKIRNQKACERWQGNRNPFVDHPGLARALFGEPRSKPYDCSSQPKPASPAVSPPSGGLCSGLGPGSLMVVGVNSDNPDRVDLLALEDLEEGIRITMTDNAWTGISFRTNEGTIVYNIPSGGIGAGTVISLDSHSWESVDGTFALSVSGDSVLVYCQDEEGSLIHITGISLAGDWFSSGQDDSSYGSNQSALPSSILAASVALPHFDNYVYNGPKRGTASALKESIGDSSNWSGSNNEYYSAPSDFVISGGESSSAHRVKRFSLNLCLPIGSASLAKAHGAVKRKLGDLDHENRSLGKKGDMARVQSLFYSFVSTLMNLCSSLHRHRTQK